MLKKLNKLFLKVDTPITHIGEITKVSEKIILKKKNGRKKALNPSMGFNHFKHKKWN